MATDAQQKGMEVRQHKRLAMGVKLNGQSMQPKGGSQTTKSSGGLSKIKNK